MEYIIKKGGNPEYIIGEAKYGKARLGKTKDGKQMSDDWITGSDRKKMLWEKIRQKKY